MKILLATDGSKCSDLAVDEVASRQWPAGSQLRIISVIEPPAPLASEPWIPSTDLLAELETVERKKAQEMLQRAEAKLRETEASGHLAVAIEVLTGSPKRVIVEEAEKWGAHLIVVGCHGYRKWERMLLGSVSQAVALHADCSVEIVRKRCNGGH